MELRVGGCVCGAVCVCGGLCVEACVWLYVCGPVWGTVWSHVWSFVRRRKNLCEEWRKKCLRNHVGNGRNSEGLSGAVWGHGEPWVVPEEAVCTAGWGAVWGVQ